MKITELKVNVYIQKCIKLLQDFLILIWSNKREIKTLLNPNKEWNAGVGTNYGVIESGLFFQIGMIKQYSWQIPNNFWKNTPKNEEEEYSKRKWLVVWYVCGVRLANATPDQRQLLKD